MKYASIRDRTKTETPAIRDGLEGSKMAKRKKKVATKKKSKKKKL
jgi:hypothetical protein